MTNDELKAQFAKCVIWQDADQWDLLGAAYFNRGYVLNAGECFKRADARRQDHRSHAATAIVHPALGRAYCEDCLPIYGAEVAVVVAAETLVQEQ